MAATVARLQAVLSADTRDFDRGMQQSETRMHKVGKVAGLAGAAIVGGLAVGMVKSVGAAKDAQVAQISLESSLKSVNISYAEHGKAIDAAIQKTSKLAALDDEDLSNSFSQLVRTTGSVTKATEGMNLAADIARARHISLAAATKMVEKAELGSANAFKRVGLSVTPVTDAQDKLKVKMHELKEELKGASGAQKSQLEGSIAQLAASVDLAKAQDKHATALKTVSEAQKRFKDAAEQYGQSSAAASERFSVAIENLQESLGKVLLPIITKVSNALASMASFMAEHEKLAKLLVVAVGALGGVLLAAAAAAKIAEAAQVLWSVATKAATAAQWLLNAALDANPIGIVVVALGALVAAVIIAYKNSETFRRIVDETWKAIKAVVLSVTGWFTDTALPAVQGFIDGIRDAFNGVKTWLQDNWKIALLALIGGIPGLIWLAFHEGWAQNFIDKLKGLFNDVVGWLRDNWKLALIGLIGAIPLAIWLALNTSWGVEFRDKLTGAFSGIVSWLTDNWKPLLVGIFLGLPGALWAAFQTDIVKELFEKVKTALVDWGTKFGGWLVDAIVDGMKGLGHAVAEKIKDELAGLKGPSGIDVAKAVGNAITGGGTGPFNADSVIPAGTIGAGVPASGTGPGSLTPSLWDEYAMARTTISNWSDLGTYNPASLLPSGAPSDHAVFPAKAFDAGFSPATGWANESARAFFSQMIGREGIHYAILGDKIWSAEQGLHEYTSGGHDNHVHVSSYDHGGSLLPGWTLAYNGTGRPEPVGGAGLAVTVNVAGSYVGDRQIEDVVVDAIARARNKGRPI